MTDKAFNPPKMPPGAVPDLPLFRREALQARRAQWMGTVLLEPKLSFTMISVASVLAAGLVAAHLFFGSYTRKARVDGWLVPELGLVRIHVQRPGTVTEIHVREGMAVKKGEPLVVQSGDIRSEALGSTSAEILARLKERRASTLEAMARQDKIFRRRAQTLRQKLFTLELQRSDLSSQTALQRGRIRIAGDALKQGRDLRARGGADDGSLASAELQQIDQLGRLESLEREETGMRGELAEARNALQELPLLRRNALAELERAVAALDQEIAETETRKGAVIVAPQDGTITAILTEPGGNATPAAPLMSLVPAGSKLQAHLYGPSKAIGFVLPGQRVSLRYQAFPYQRFGAYGGTVSSVSRSPVKPTELPALPGAAASPAAAAAEPVYRITVDLDTQAARAYGGEIPLQSGMTVEADVSVDTRKLYEWVLDPIYTMTGKAAK